MTNLFQSIIRYRAIDKCISSKGAASIDELIKCCQEESGDNSITRAQVVADIEVMKKTGSQGYNAPIEFSEQKGKYSYSKNDFSLNKIALTPMESQAIAEALNLIGQLEEHYSLAGMQGMIQKIADTIKIQGMSAQGKKFDFVQSEQTQRYGGSQFLSPLINAIENHSVIRIYYHPFYEDKPYFTIVHPYLLKEYKNRWYLIGLNDIKKEIRTYGLDRIWEIHEIDQKYIPRNFSAKEYFRNTIGVISPIGEPPEIRIKVTKHQAQYLITQPLHESQFIESEDEDSVIFQYKVHPTYEFKSYLLSLGPDARVLSPDKLKREVLRLLNDAILEYGKGKD